MRGLPKGELLLPIVALVANLWDPLEFRKWVPEEGGEVQACSWEGEHAKRMRGKAGLEKAAWNRVGPSKNRKQEKKVAMFMLRSKGMVYLTGDFLHLTDRKLKNFGIFIQTCIKTKQQTTVIEQISPISHPGRGLKLGPLSIPIRSFPLLGEKTSTSGSWDP